MSVSVARSSIFCAQSSAGRSLYVPSLSLLTKKPRSAPSLFGVPGFGAFPRSYTQSLPFPGLVDVAKLTILPLPFVARRCQAGISRKAFPFELADCAMARERPSSASIAGQSGSVIPGRSLVNCGASVVLPLQLACIVRASRLPSVSALCPLPFSAPCSDHREVDGIHPLLNLALVFSVDDQSRFVLSAKVPAE